MASAYKFNIAKKLIAMKYFGNHFPIYVVNEYPKSGGTWVKNMLADALGIPAWTRDKSPFQRCVMLSHSLKNHRNKKTVVLFRDGRDVMVSFYFHSFFYNEFLNAAHVDNMRKRLIFEDYNDINANLLEFMKDIYNNPVSPSFSWPSFVDHWLNREDIVYTSYEALRSNTSSELLRVARACDPNKEFCGEDIDQIVKKYSLKNVKKTPNLLSDGLKSEQAAQHSFIRKGSMGGWGENFNDEALAWFESVAGKQLLSLGYKLGRSVG